MLLASAPKSSTVRIGTLDSGSARQVNHHTSTPSSKYPPGSLGARLVTITFLLSDNNNNDKKDSTTAQSHTLTLPRTLDIYRVKALLLRARGKEWGLRPLAFDLQLLSPSNGDDGEYEEIPDSTRRIGDWIEEGLWECTIRVKPRDTGDEVVQRTMDLGRLMVV